MFFVKDIWQEFKFRIWYSVLILVIINVWPLTSSLFIF